MKKQLMLMTALFAAISAFAQNNVNLVVFSEDGDPFYAYVNGAKQNATPETNVRIANISPNIALRIEFENKALPQLKQNMSLEPGFEHTAKIKRDMKGQMKLRYFGQTPLAQATDNGATTVQYHTASGDATASDSQGAQSVTSTTTTVTTSTGDAGSVNMNMGGIGISMNVNVPQGSTTMQSSSSSTVTTRTSSSGYASDNTQQAQAPASTPAGCSAPMNASSFSKMKASVEAKPFSDTKMSTARVATKNACLSVDQVKEICKLFSMDDDKLAYAKYAYDYCVDKGSYYQVAEVFSFSTTADELNKFLDK